MPDGVWIGGIYLRDEGGHEVALRALRYYLKVLRDISTAPDVYGPPTIALLLQQEADRIGPAVLNAGRSLKKGLVDPVALAEIRRDTKHIQRALESYVPGVRAAAEGSKYHCRFVEPGYQSEDEARLAEEAQRRIGETA